MTPFAPAFHIIDHIIYHTSFDVPELVPAVGLGYSMSDRLRVNAAFTGSSDVSNYGAVAGASLTLN